jgi:hypothetical protein
VKEAAPRTHILIPDTQAKPGAPTDHLGWVGQYIVDKFHDQDVEIIHIGDHADMLSLSSYDEGKKEMEGRRYWEDIRAANAAFDLLNDPLIRFNRHRLASHKVQWQPSKHIMLGNHEDRINRAISGTPKLEGTIGISDLNYARHGWQVHPFLEPAFIDGVGYAHYWYNPMSGKPYGGMIETRLKNIGQSFTMGHQQGLYFGIRYVGGQQQCGLVAGSCYLHDEEYKGPQGNAHWRGIVVCHEVCNGSYDPMFVSLNFLCRHYEGKSLQRFMARHYSIPVV